VEGTLRVAEMEWDEEEWKAYKKKQCGSGIIFYPKNYINFQKLN
jgi:hypothetical protein